MHSVLYRSVSFYTGLQYQPSVSELRDSCSLPIMDLQSHNKLERLRLSDLAIDCLQLPAGRSRFRYLDMNNVTMTHYSFKQLWKSLSSCFGLEEFGLNYVTCIGYRDRSCQPVMDLRQLDALLELRLWDLCVEGVTLPVEGMGITVLYLYNVTMTHHYWDQPGDALSSCFGLEDLYLCGEQSHSCSLLVLDLKPEDQWSCKRPPDIWAYCKYKNK